MERLEVLWWKGIKGTANLLYPHPKSWTFKEVAGGIPLDLLEISDLTGAIGANDTGEPSCIKNWNDRSSSWHILAEIDWAAYGRSYASRLTTNNDIWAHFKNILHRRLVVRAHCPSDTGSSRCRCCGDARETHTHLVRCRVLWEVWKVFRRLANAVWKHNNISNELVFLGVTEQGELLPPGLLALHRVMWKIVMIALTRAEFENIPVSPKQIWNITFRRITVRARGLYTAHTRAVRSARMHDRTPPKPASVNRWTDPIAKCEDGGLHWHKEWVMLSYAYGVNLRSWEFTAGAETPGEG